MMGKTHAATAGLGGLLIAPHLGLDTYSTALPFAAVMAGCALLPDLDHPKATAAASLGPITGAVSKVLRGASAWLYARTKGPRDEDCVGTHRHLSHTVLFALVLGGLCWASVAAAGAAAVAVWVGFALLLAHAVLGRIALAAFSAAALSWLPDIAAAADVWPAVLGTATEIGGWLPVAVLLGCIAHDLGDAVTESGCPFLFPVPILGETWYELRPPRLLRFRTGKWFETVMLFPLVMVCCVLALPGVWPVVSDIGQAVAADAAAHAR